MKKRVYGDFVQDILDSIDDTGQEKYPEVPWKKMAGMSLISGRNTQEALA
jgi:uncharacterized protein with HEPN domain